MPPVRAQYLTNPLMFTATNQAVQLQQSSAATIPVGDLIPDAVRRWLARLRLLEGVPFAHLVPDADLLPPESIRFFYLDRAWTDALVDGALSVSTVTTLDREQLQGLHAQVRNEIDGEERRVRMVGSDDPAPAPAGAISGFILRSRAVSGWPAMHVRAYSEEIGRDDVQIAEDDPRRMRLLRLERLAPAVLFCLFDGIPAIVHLEEPRSGIQFGVDLSPGTPQTVTIPLRDVTTATRLDDMNPVPSGSTTATVPFRAGAPGVVHVTELARLIAAQRATKVDLFESAGVQSAEFAMEMLQFPYRQVFGDPAKSTRAGAKPLTWDQLFHPTVAMSVVQSWESGATR
jgi:hypothetical protein